MTHIFMTGSCGLVGRALRLRLEKSGHTVVGCDLRADVAGEKFDLRDSHRVRHAMQNCGGVIHLGAISRIVQGEKYPDLCNSVNVEGTKNVAFAAWKSPHHPWLLFSSSREVYGNPPRRPCTPDSPINPENVYARTKVAAERIVSDIREKQVTVAILRFSNVFGAVTDHPDRVVPAFARAAAVNGVLRVEGADNFYDFTPLNDTVDAVMKTIDVLESGVADLPPVDIVTGRATPLRELAEMALSLGGGSIVEVPPRGLGAVKFQGDPRPAQRFLDWRSMESLEKQIARLVNEFKEVLCD